MTGTIAVRRVFLSTAVFMYILYHAAHFQANAAERPHARGNLPRATGLFAGDRGGAAKMPAGDNSRDVERATGMMEQWKT